MDDSAMSKMKPFTRFEILIKLFFGQTLTFG
jgi:hypothetical protein